jgi:hypothetical protein
VSDLSTGQQGLLIRAEAEDMGSPERADRWVPLIDLSFIGGRFDSASVELEIGQELVEFQRIVTSVAGDLWKAQHPTKQRLPPNFDAQTKLRFSKIERSSTKLPLEAPVEEYDGAVLFKPGASPYLIQSLDLILLAIKTQEHNLELPPAFPRERVGMFASWGSKLAENESITIGNGKPEKCATFTKTTRKRFFEYTNELCEDLVTLYGVVRIVDKDNGKATLRLANRRKIEVRVKNELMPQFCYALNKESPVRLTGLAILSRIDGVIKSMQSVTEFAHVEQPAGDALADWLAEAESRDAWRDTPADASMRMDDYLSREH